MLNDSLFSSKKDDWNTPQNLFDRLNEEYSFNLDPCCFKETAKCKDYFTPLEDGLKQDWFGNVFMNPPYGRDIKHWVKKAKDESEKNNCVVVCLLPARTDTRWWHEYCMKSSEIKLCNKRLSFEGSTNKATFPTAIVVFRKNQNTPVLSSYEI